MAVHILDKILHPRSIAVVGASSSVDRRVDFVAPLLTLGYKGEIYPVNPKYSEIMDIKAYPSLNDIPGPVDYVISLVPASGILDMLEDCHRKGVKFVHLYTARFSETGRQGTAELEKAILAKAREKGIRLLGPNCMGVYYPGEGMSFQPNFPAESGTVGLASQSAGVAAELIRSAALRGIRFSKVISYGNALDLNECDFLEYFSQDPETRIIMMYVEGVRGGKGFFKSLRQAASVKPVIIMKGGRGKSGARATASHTASLAGSTRIWETLVAQAGAIPANNPEDLIDLATSFRFLPPIRGNRVGIAGGAGGEAVLAADQCEDAGLDVIPLPGEIREELKKEGNPVWDWVGNPVDTSIRETNEFTAGRMLQLMAENDQFDLLIAMILEPPQRNHEIATAESHLKQYNLDRIKIKPTLAVVADRSSGIEHYDRWSGRIMSEVRTKLIAENVPFYPTIGRAARAAGKLVEYHRKRAGLEV